MNLHIDYSPLPAQDEFHNLQKKYRLLSGAYRAGKTKAGCQEGIKLSLKYPKNRGLIGRKDFPDLRDTTQRTFFEELSLYETAYGQPFGDIRFGKSEGIPGFRKMENIFKFRESFGGSEILFRQLKDPEDFKSLDLGWFYLDEGTETTLSMFLMLISRLSLKHVPQRCGFITTNPDTPLHWIHKMFIDKKTDDFGVVHTTSYDNPHLPSDYLPSLEGVYDEDYKRRYLKGIWGVMSGGVYKEFNRDIHVILPFKIPDEWRRYRTIDFGYTNPFVCLWVAVDPDENIYIYDEHYQKEKLLNYHARIIHEKSEGQNFTGTYADPSGKQERAELAGLENYPISTIPALNDIEMGIQAVKRKLKVKDNGKPSLYIFDTNNHTILEFELYRWADPSETKNELEIPIKKDDHVMDSIRYLIFSLSREFEPQVIGDLTELTSMM